MTAEAATAGGEFGLYPAADFRITTGACSDASAIRQALWYFRDQTIAVPAAQFQIAGFATGMPAFDDLRQWLQQRAAGATIDYPPLIWIAAPQVIRRARLTVDGNSLAAATGEVGFRVTPKIPLNRSYFDSSSVAYFAQRTITVRGESSNDAFVARTLWPEDFRLGPAAPPLQALADPSSPAASLRGLMRDAPHGGAASPFLAATLWQRDTQPKHSTGSPVLALMVNGAQGDDDEAHGGHFALVTGRVRSDGAIGDWLVNNYYSLDVESEKGILAAPTPLDNYLGDLNSGQAWYRPSYLLVAVLRDERAAVLVQSALNRVYNQFYRHQLDYYHPSQNCTSISVDVLRALGWSVPMRSASNRVLAWLSFPFLLIREASLRKAKLAFDYLVSDRTRLLPAAALEEAFASLLSLLRHQPREADDGRLARMLADDVEALVYLRFPQFPSSRVIGDTPVVSLHEYRARVPRDPALVQIVPVPPRPFPDDLRDPDLLPRRWRPSDYAALLWGALAAIAIAGLLWWV
ncbi:MAG: hypothetical protein IT521_10770 [Burkholderiales bacterium]|nr:hypothetical protein [Burkholderiales bacterium]